jgi:hypothetical protein
MAPEVVRVVKAHEAAMGCVMFGWLPEGRSESAPCAAGRAGVTSLPRVLVPRVADGIDLARVISAGSRRPAR